jgi:hypothetical protein
MESDGLLKGGFKGKDERGEKSGAAQGEEGGETEEGEEEVTFLHVF